MRNDPSVQVHSVGGSGGWGGYGAKRQTVVPVET